MSEHCILIIEDQEDLAVLYKTALETVGYTVRIASTGEEGIAEFQAEGAELILLDMTLPEMHGSQVLHEIRALNSSVPVIVITGQESEQTRDQCERLGVQDYLTKPLDYDQLVAGVERALVAPAEESEMVTLRLPKRVIERLSAIDSNLERAIVQLCDKTK